jgi:hypothetical protein
VTIDIVHLKNPGGDICKFFEERARLTEIWATFKGD